MSSPQAIVAPNQVTQFRPRNSAQRAAIALIKIKTFVGAANSQNILEA
jgi:hypothetical protein